MLYHIQIIRNKAQIEQPGYQTQQYTPEELAAVIANTTHPFRRLAALRAAKRLLERHLNPVSLPAFLTRRKESYRPK
jgi:hypothetical protein